MHAFCRARARISISLEPCRYIGASTRDGGGEIWKGAVKGQGSVRFHRAASNNVITGSTSDGGALHPRSQSAEEDQRRAAVAILRMSSSPPRQRQEARAKGRSEGGGAGGGRVEAPSQSLMT